MDKNNFVNIEKTKMSEEKKNQLYQISLKVVLYKDDKILVLRDGKTHSEEHKKPEGWNLPGGRILNDEKIEEALAREIKEEFGDIKYEIKGIIESIKFTNSDGLGVVLYYAVEYIDGDIKLIRENRELKWLSTSEILEGKDIAEWMKKAIVGFIKKNELENSLNNWKRTQADFENYKKRQAEARNDLIKYSTENIILQILPILDNFHASVAYIPEDQKNNPWVTGIMHIKKQMEDTLKDNGVDEIEAMIGDEFDPRLHEAVSENQELVEGEKNKITKIIQNGYKIGERVIRPAKVVVG